MHKNNQYNTNTKGSERADIGTSVLHRGGWLNMARPSFNEVAVRLVENINDFLENIDNNLAYYEIPAQLACAYLKGHLKGRALDWFEVLGYRVIEDKATDYAHLKQALSEQFPVVRNRSELETRFYSSSQRRDQQPSDFIYELLKIHKVLKLEMLEEKLIYHVVSRLEPQILDYVEVRRPQNTANLMQIVDKYEERFMNRQIRGSTLWDTGAEKSFISEEVYHKYFSYRPRQKTKDRVVTAQGAPCSHLDTGDKGPVVSRPYRYDRVKQGIIEYHIDKMLRDGTICPINLPYASPVVRTRKKNDLPPDSPETYRFAIDYRKLNVITKYPRYLLPMIDVTYSPIFLKPALCTH
ncbi:uncharacterized protein TNCV_3151341 [Trichonephila clavipes]|nr:uncharacterized protein TNCV_3151341 [Trichonephila clavipes]